MFIQLFYGYVCVFVCNGTGSEDGGGKAIQENEDDIW